MAFGGFATFGVALGYYSIVAVVCTLYFRQHLGHLCSAVQAQLHELEYGAHAGGIVFGICRRIPAVKQFYQPRCFYIDGKNLKPQMLPSWAGVVAWIPPVCIQQLKPANTASVARQQLLVLGIPSLLFPLAPAGMCSAMSWVAHHAASHTLPHLRDTHTCTVDRGPLFHIVKTMCQRTPCAL
jgi:hypothetical protein